MSLLVRILFALMVAIVIAPGPSGRSRARQSLRRPCLKLAAQRWRPARWMTPRSCLRESIRARQISTSWTFFTARSPLAGAIGNPPLPAFRAILARDPTLLRVRLDLAVAFFRAREDSSAAYHFRQGARGRRFAACGPCPDARVPRGDPPAQVVVDQRVGRTRPRQQHQCCDQRPPGPNCSACRRSSRKTRVKPAGGRDSRYLGRVRGAHFTGLEVPHPCRAIYADPPEKASSMTGP